jgi:predicted SprT family Zn-dependent metalloprotease
LDNTVFGHKKFRIEDSTAFSINGHYAEYVNAPSPDSVILHEGSGRLEIFEITVCWDIEIPANSGQVVGCPPGLDCPLYVTEHHCETWTISGDDGYGIDGDDPAPPDGDYGGSGGNDLCRLFPGTSHSCGDGEPPPYIPITDYNDSFNPDVFDSLRIANDLRDSFPCAYHIIHDTLFNINQLVQNQMFNNFFVSQANHIYFKVDWTMTNNAEIANTNPHGRRTTVNGIPNWTDTISFNPYYLRTMSKDFLMATILHETLHSYIRWCFQEYKRTTPFGTGEVSAQYLMEHFPLHWQRFNGLPWTESYSHEIMAYNYKRYIYDYLYLHRDMSIDSNLWKWKADNLAKSGFWETSAWGHNLFRLGVDLSDTCTIRAVEFWNQEFSDPNTSYFVWGNCRVTGTAFRDSLQMKTPCQ